MNKAIKKNTEKSNILELKRKFKKMESKLAKLERKVNAQEAIISGMRYAHALGLDYD